MRDVAIKFFLLITLNIRAKLPKLNLKTNTAINSPLLNNEYTITGTIFLSTCFRIQTILKALTLDAFVLFIFGMLKLSNEIEGKITFQLFIF